MGSTKLEEPHYDAFISYRHTELDMFAAKTLHKELESFRLPKNLVKRLGQDNIPKTRIRRVFRDQDELPISSDLKEPILYALRNSDFLIVICSPRLRESLWCRTEIEQFIAMHGHERVLLVLAEGEPQESFPEQLCYVMENGRKKKIEPLAADIRGATRRKMRKKIKSETLRLAAPIFGCGYDDLRQRHRERRLKRIMAATTAAAVICFTFGAVSTGMAMRIRSQSLQIESQKKEIEYQYTEALETNARGQAEEALRILDTGDRSGAVRTVLEVLPGPDNPGMPYTPQAQYAMTQCLGVYEDGRNILPRHVLSHEAAVDFIKTSPDKKLLLTADRYGKLYVWDALEGALLYENEELAKINLSENTVGFLDDNRIFFPLGFGMGVYDLSLGKIVYQEESQSYFAAAVSRDGRRYALRGSGNISVYDAGSYELLYGCAMPGDCSWTSDLAFDESGERIAFTWENSDSGLGASIVITLADAKESTNIAEFDRSQVEIADLALSGGSLTVAYNTLDYTDRNCRVACIDITGEAGLRWDYQGRVIDSFFPFWTADGGRILLNQYDTVVLLRADTGEELGQAAVGGTVIGIEPDPEGYYAGLRLQNGEYHLLNYADMRSANMAGDYNFKAVPSDLTDSAAGQDYMASLAYNSSDIIVHAQASGSRMARLLETDYYINDILVKSDESAAVLYSSDGLIALDPDSGEVLWTYEGGEPAMSAVYLGEGQDEIAVALPHGILLLDAAAGSVIKELDLGNLDLSNAKFSVDGTRFAIASPWDISIYDTAGGELLVQDGHLEELESAGAYGLSENLETYAVACPGERQLKVFHTGNTNQMISIPLNAASVQDVTVLSAADRIFVTYLDGRVEGYSISQGSLLKEYKDLPFELKDARLIKGKDILLLGTDAACVVDRNGEPLALLGGPCAALPDKGIYLTAGPGTLLSFPAYDVPMLREDAEAVIGKAGE